MSSNQKSRPASEQGQCDGRMPGSAGNAHPVEKLREKVAEVLPILEGEKEEEQEEDYICHISQRRDIQGGDESAGAGAGPPGVSSGGPDDAMIEIEDLRTFDMWTNFVRIVSA